MHCRDIKHVIEPVIKRLELPCEKAGVLRCAPCFDTHQKLNNSIHQCNTILLLNHFWGPISFRYRMFIEQRKANQFLVCCYDLIFSYVPTDEIFHPKNL